MDQITVQTIVRAPVEKVWAAWTRPEHIVQWAFASDDWEAPAAENDVRSGGRFKTVMAAKDGTARFDFTGTYTRVEEGRLLAYDMDKAPGETAARQIRVEFAETADGVQVTETFDMEHENPAEVQRQGWQTILENFKKYVEHK